MRGFIPCAALGAILAVAGCSSSGRSGQSPAPGAAARGTGAQTSPPSPDGRSYTSANAIESALSATGQQCNAGVAPDASDFPGATDAATCYPAALQGQSVTIVVFGSHKQAAAYAGTAVVAPQGQVAITTALLGANWVLTTTSSSFGPTAQGVLGGTIEAPKEAPSPTPATTRAPEQVTYACTGHGSVDITYGPNGSQHTASHLPFKHTDVLIAGAQYYATTAQLQGSGSVSCATTVQTDDLLGYAQTVSNSASADGGYNIATAQVCSGVDGWEKC